MEKKKTLVIGASENPSRYSYLAVQKLTAHQYPVIALGLKKGSIGNIEIETEKKNFEQIDTITLYINTGTENDELGMLGKKNGIQCLEACTLVLLSTGQY